MDSKELAAALTAATEAAVKIMEVYARDAFEVKEKEDKSPITEADLAAQEIIMARLRKDFAYPILSEEAPIPYSDRKDWKTFWLVDPLDGTKDFVNRTGEFTVNIALISGMKPVLGVVGIPAENLIYAAELGKGAFRMRGSERESIRNSRSGQPLYFVDSRFHSSSQIAKYAETHPEIKVERCGSAKKFCILAEGNADVYPRFFRNNEWDTGAGHCILKECGCSVIDLGSRTELTYNKENVVNEGFVAYRSNLDPFTDLKEWFHD